MHCGILFNMLDDMDLLLIDGGTEKLGFFKSSKNELHFLHYGLA